MDKDRHEEEFEEIKLGKYIGKDIWEIKIEFESSNYREHIFLNSDELESESRPEYGDFNLYPGRFILNYETENGEREIEHALDRKVQERLRENLENI